MKLVLEPTSRIVEIETVHGDVVPARVWQGVGDHGIEVACLITRVAVHKDHDQSPFAENLEPQVPHRAAIEAFPMRLVL